MGRRKLYDRDAVLTLAMQMFWADGFHSTSARELAAAMGINVSTLYAEFGSKDGLYAEAIGLYEREVVTQLFAGLEAPDASLATLRETLLQFPILARSVAKAPGCLVTNAAIEHAPSAQASHDTMTRYIARISEGIQRALTNATRSKAIDPSSVTQLSHQLVAVLLGMFVMTRAQVDEHVLEDVAASAVAQLDAYAATFGLAGKP